MPRFVISCVQGYTVCDHKVPLASISAGDILAKVSVKFIIASIVWFYLYFVNGYLCFICPELQFHDVDHGIEWWKIKIIATATNH